MNILVTNDDGVRARGLQILQEAAKRMWPTARIVTIVPALRKMGTSMSVSPQLPRPVALKPPPPPGVNVYDGTPADLIDVAFFHKSLWLPVEETWDLVLAGINHGQNVGFDVLRSGTVGQALVASHAYSCSAMAFSQHLGHTDPNKMYANADDTFRHSIQYMHEVLNQALDLDEAGTCWNVNFPASHLAPKGLTWAQTAHYSVWRLPPTDIVPRAADEISDHTQLEKGYVTLTPLSLRVNEALRF